MNAQFAIFTVDESRHWRADILARCGGKILTVYLFRVGEATHCCSITPSTYAEPVEHLPACEIDDETDEMLREALADDDGRYFPYREAGADVREFEADEENDDEARRDIWDQARESYRANCAQGRAA